MKHFDKPLPRVLTYLPGWGDSDIFTHMYRLRPFLGVQNILISIFFGDFHIYMDIYKCEYPLPPPPHTHKHWAYMYMHQGLVIIAFAHARIQIFTFFRLLISQRGPYAKVPYQFLFFLTENYSTCINRHVRGPRMMRKSLL